MSEQTKQEVVTDLDPSFFQAYSKKVAEESKKSTGQSNFPQREFEDIGYTGLETGVNKIYRVIGAPPGSETMGYVRKNYDPKQVMMCEVKDDEGKKFTIRLPLREDIAAHNHILHRLYDKITEVVWVNRKKVFVNETKYPDLWKMITKGNYTENDGKTYSISAGFKSTTYTVMNVIDRQDDWCEKNKHTKILCNDIGVSTNPKTQEVTYWPKPGIKTFSLKKRLAEIVGKYGNLETYDIAFKKTGEQDNPLELRNASLYKSKSMMEEIKNTDGTLPDENIIICGPLTSEEKSYVRYDLDKLYQPTSYTKLLKRVAALFKLTDAYLGSKFFQELEDLSEKEKEEWARLYPKGENNDEAEQVAVENKTINEEVKKEEAPVTPKRRTAIGPVANLSDDKIALLKGWSKLNDHQKSLIKDIKTKDGVVSEIEWEECDETKGLFACDCHLPSPETFETCPGCGANFV